MKLPQSKIKQIIKEEFKKVLNIKTLQTKRNKIIKELNELSPETYDSVIQQAPKRIQGNRASSMVGTAQDLKRGRQHLKKLVGQSIDLQIGHGNNYSFEIHDVYTHTDNRIVLVGVINGGTEDGQSAEVELTFGDKFNFDVEGGTERQKVKVIIKMENQQDFKAQLSRSAIYKIKPFLSHTQQTPSKHDFPTW